MMKTLMTLCLTVLLGAGLGFGQSTTFAKTDLSQAEIDKIVATFTQNEGRFREALNSYNFNRNATISTIGMGGQITGTYRRDSLLTFDSSGKRMEKILFAPISTLTEIVVTQNDLENLGGLDPFAIEPAQVDKYKFTYLGKEKIDEVDLFVFDVEPKVMPKVEKNGLKLFSGRIWVDDRDFFIVKSKGKAVPEGKERFATIETWRENIDGKYWFPSFSTSDDELVFPNGYVVKVRIRVKYSNYGVGRTDVKAIGDDDETPEPEPKPSPSPTPGGKKPV
jgi:outer membrane lipoprotein-sorting protein